jgi:hypothetical protein
VVFCENNKHDCPTKSRVEKKSAIRGATAGRGMRRLYGFWQGKAAHANGVRKKKIPHDHDHAAPALSVLQRKGARRMESCQEGRKKSKQKRVISFARPGIRHIFS